MSDRFARVLAACSLGAALLAVALAAYALVLGSQQRSDIRTLGRTLRGFVGEMPGGDLHKPPPELDTSEE